MTPDLAKNLATYNLWMNQRIYDAAEKLSDDRRRKDCGAFFKSIHGTLNHILLADKVWLGRLTGDTFSAKSLDQELYHDFSDLKSERSITDQALIDYVSGLSEQTIAGKLCYTSMVNPEPREYDMSIVLAHVFNHQTHHRGQLTTILSQMGVDIGVTDLIFMPRGVQ